MQHMTVEELSHASADRCTDRMMHDVRTTAQIRFPPRPPPTFSARESLEAQSDDRGDGIPVEETENNNSALPVTEDTSPIVQKKHIRTAKERFRDFYTNFESLEPLLSTHLTHEDKKRFISAIRGPRSHHRLEPTTIAVSILVVTITAMVCLNHTPPSRESLSRALRSPSVTSTSSPSGMFSGASSSTTNFNIDRILKPFSQHH